MSFNKVINLFALISSVMVGIDSQKYCNNTEPLDSIFTIGDYTIAKKGHRYFQTIVGKTLNSGRDLDMSTLFKKVGNVKFMTIDTGFMITKTPDCSKVAKNVTKICNEMQEKLLNKVFVIGTTASGQEYVTYIYEDIIGPYKTLMPVTDNDRLPSYVKHSGLTVGDFWPIKDNSKAQSVILRSVFDERSVTIIHIVFYKINGMLQLFTYNLMTMESTPKFKLNDDKETNDRMNQDVTILGFFKMPANVDKNIYAISKSKKADAMVLVLSFSINFSFEPFSDVALENITGCPKITTTSSTTPPPNGPSVTTAPKPEAPKSSETPLPRHDDEGKVDDVPSLSSTTAEPESSSSWIWILVIIVIGIILLIAIVMAILCLGKNKEKDKEKVKDQEKEVETIKTIDD